MNGHDRLDEADAAPFAERRGLVVGQVGRELVDVVEFLELREATPVHRGRWSF